MNNYEVVRVQSKDSNGRTIRHTESLEIMDLIAKGEQPKIKVPSNVSILIERVDGQDINPSADELSRMYQSLGTYYDLSQVVREHSAVSSWFSYVGSTSRLAYVNHYAPATTKKLSF